MPAKIQTISKVESIAVLSSGDNLTTIEDK